MSVRRHYFGGLPENFDQQQQSQMNTYDPNVDLVTQNDTVQSIPTKFNEIVRKLLPQEFAFDMSVNNVEFIEYGCKSLTGTLYLSNFRIVFVPDNDNEENTCISSGNKFIGEYDIPLASIYKINVAPVDSRTGFKSFLNENQIQSETRTFTIITRDFRQVTFTKFSVTKSNTINSKNPQMSITRMEKYIEALKMYSRCQSRKQLYLYNIIEAPWKRSPLRDQRNYPASLTSIVRSLDDDISEFLGGNDERIKSYMTFDDWSEELYQANEQRWIVNRKKFDEQSIIRTEGPYVQLMFNNSKDAESLIWHWTHTSQVETIAFSKRQVQPQKNMLITVTGTGEATSSAEPLRRVTTDANLTGSSDIICDQLFYRYNLSKFPCNLKRLQASYEKLIEICVTPQEDDDKWLSKLHASKWLKYVSKTLHGAASLAKLLDFKNISLVGSDTDYSCLMSSLVQILLRPKCRTIKGFCELIVREWIIRGHKFVERFGQVLYDSSGNVVEEAPVFLLFLDCVHQLIVQNPFSFEFTDNLLLELYRDVCYCYHHTFVFNDVIERLEMSSNYPKCLLILSSFDFSLYLDSETCLLLKNQASTFNIEPPSSSSHQQKKSQIEATVLYPSSPALRFNNRTVYYVEASKSRKLSADIPITNGSLTINSEHYEYDMIESPQVFSSNFQVDWRIFNLVLWSKCYCRHDQNYMPTSSERQLSFDINCIKEDIENMHKKPVHIILDSFQNVGHANSWQPQTLVTRV